MPESRAMPSIGVRCHELRLRDVGGTWRIIYRVDEDAVVILELFQKKTTKTRRGSSTPVAGGYEPTMRDREGAE